MKRRVPLSSTAIGMLVGLSVGSVVFGATRPAGACSCSPPYEVATLQLDRVLVSDSSDTGAREVERWPEIAELVGYDYSYYAYIAFYEPTDEIEADLAVRGVPAGENP